jgi:protein-S-isoprenylcysteine O-methyltransferase
VLTTVLSYIAAVGFLVVERKLRQGDEAKRRDATAADRGSTMRIARALVVSILALLAAPILNRWTLSRLSERVAWLGVALAMGGLSLRVWANRTLGRFYTRTLRMTGDQTIVRRGPYKLIRHPGYAGVMTLFIGAGLGTANWIVTIVIAVLMVTAYTYRISSEERMLVATLGQDYRDYMAKTWRLIPLLY